MPTSHIVFLHDPDRELRLTAVGGETRGSDHAADGSATFSAELGPLSTSSAKVEPTCCDPVSVAIPGAVATGPPGCDHDVGVGAGQGPRGGEQLLEQDREQRPGRPDDPDTRPVDQGIEELLLHPLVATRLSNGPLLAAERCVRKAGSMTRWEASSPPRSTTSGVLSPGSTRT